MAGRNPRKKDPRGSSKRQGWARVRAVARAVARALALAKGSGLQAKGKCRTSIADRTPGQVFHPSTILTRDAEQEERCPRGRGPTRARRMSLTHQIGPTYTTDFFILYHGIYTFVTMDSEFSVERGMSEVDDLRGHGKHMPMIMPNSMEWCSLWSGVRYGMVFVM